MTDADRAHNLASEVEKARRAYRALASGRELPPDPVLAISEDYRVLLNAGTRIRTLGSRDLFLQTKNRLFSDDPDLSARAARDLEYLWAGIQDWPVHDVRGRMH
ncbi:MAG: hypothetical protein Q7T25_10220 [Sideroxyarcus sp.]|nr:hypothetical protein [Sideroxyarcus sp.]